LTERARVLRDRQARSGVRRAAAVLAEKTFADLRQVAADAAVLCERGADGVDDEAGLAAPDAHETGGDRRSLRVEFERINRAAIDTADDEVDLLQAFECLEIDLVDLRAQVGAFHEKVAKIAREVGVGEIVFVQGPRRQERDARISRPLCS